MVRCLLTRDVLSGLCLLQMHPDKRPTAQEALQHPGLKSASSSQSEDEVAAAAEVAGPEQDDGVV